MMNEMIRNALNESCGEYLDLFEKAFDESTTHHNFSLRHKRRMNAIFKNCDNPALARKKYEAKPFLSEFGIKQAAVTAAGFVVASGLMFGGVKAVDFFSEIANIEAETNKRYDELLRDGNYYLTTDDSIYFKVGNGTITLCGDKEKIIELFMKDESMVKANERDPEFTKNWATTLTEDHMTEKHYALVEAGEMYYEGENGEKRIPIGNLKYGFVNLNDLPDYPWASFVFQFGPWQATFDGEDTIRITRFGDFVLAE